MEIVLLIAFVSNINIESLLTRVPFRGVMPGYAIIPQIAPVGSFFPLFPPFDLRRINSAWLRFRQRKTQRWVRQGRVARGTW